jgi:hypothetical protein
MLAALVTGGDFADPRLTDYDLLLQNLADLKRGLGVQVLALAALGVQCSAATPQPCSPVLQAASTL